MIDVLDYDEAYDTLNNLHYNDDKTGNSFTMCNKTFRSTRYSSQNSMKDFFTKFHEYTELTRKGTLTKITPSFAFIKSTQTNLIIPNPTGLLKRKGDDSLLSFK